MITCVRRAIDSHRALGSRDSRPETGRTVSGSQRFDLLTPRHLANRPGTTTMSKVHLSVRGFAETVLAPAAHHEVRSGAVRMRPGGTPIDEGG